MRSPIIPAQLITPHVPPGFGLEGTSWLACGISTFAEMVLYCFTPSTSYRDSSISDPCDNVPARADGTFDLEIGVVLPDLFPALDGKNEYAVDVAVEGMPARRVAVSNLISRLRYQIDGKPLQALTHRSVVGRVRKGEVELIPKDAPEEPLRTFVTSQFRIPGATAAQALDEHLSDTFDTLLLYLNQLLRMVSLIDEGPGRVYSTAYTRSTFEAFYFLLVGSSTEMEKLGHGRVMPHAGRTFFNPPTLSADQSVLLRRFLERTASPTDIHALIHAARRYLEAGALDFSVLLSVVAAEIATRRFVFDRCLALGVSKKKLEGYEADYKFSMLINVEMFVLTPPDLKPDRDLIGRINRARDMRNDYMHEGINVKDKATAYAVVGDASTYIKYIEGVRKQLGA
jgi:hypothetical protein